MRANNYLTYFFHKPPWIWACEMSDGTTEEQSQIGRGPDGDQHQGDKILRRRSQKRRIDWRKMTRLVRRWIPANHICHLRTTG